MAEDDFESSLMAMQDRLLGYVCSLGASPVDAEDILHNAFVRALKYRDTFEPGTDFTSWIFAVTRSAFYDHCKTIRRIRRRRQAYEDEPIYLDQKGPDHSLRAIVDPRILRAIEAMHPSHREVFLAVVVDDMSYEDVSARLSIPIGTVMSRMHRARRYLILSLAPFLRELGYPDLLQSKRAKRVLGDDT